MLHTITVYMAVTLVLLILIFAAVIILFVLVNRKKTSIAEVYYDSFDRKDSMEYLKFDDIISSNPNEPLKGAGVMVVNQREFVAAINVVGYNFFSASYDTQVNTINATISMMDSLERPISLRQTVKAIDISHNIEAFRREVVRLEGEIEQLRQQCQETVEEAEDYLDENPDVSVELMDKAKKLNNIIERKRRQHGEAVEMIRYMEEISVKSGDTQKVQNIVFSYVYDGTQFTTQLTKEEIYAQAMQELDNMASSLISSLYRCGCSARRCSAEELVDLMRRHMHPITCDDDSVQDLFNSNLDSLFVTSDSLLSVVREQMTEEAYERRIKAMEAEIAEIEKRNRLLSERAESDRLNVTREMAGSQIHIDL